MPTAIPAGLRLGTARPEEAIAAFRARNLLEPSFVWQDVFQQEHGAAFAAAGVTRRDVLQALADELDLSITEGRSLGDFSRRARERLHGLGFWGDVEVEDPANPGSFRRLQFNDARLRTIFEVNTRQSHAVGRWERIERDRRRRPFILYRTMQDERVRASHRPWNGLVLPIDHPFWEQHYPPNGWRCRCTAFAVSETDIERRRAAGEVLNTEAPEIREGEFLNRRTGEVVRVAQGVDPGFGYNPGRERLRRISELRRDAIDTAAPDLAEALVRDIVQSADFERFIRAPLVDEALPVALLREEAADLIGSRTRTVLLNRQTVLDQAGELQAIDYRLAQLAVQTGERFSAAPGRVAHVLQRDGLVIVATVAVEGDAVVLASLRRLQADEAEQDAELRRLRRGE